MKIRKKRGFTIVEMLMVIAVLAVLIGIVTTASSSIIRNSRSRKNKALCTALQVGIATYYQQENHWPPQGGKLQDWADNGLDAKDRSEGKHVATLEDKDYDELMREIVTRCLSATESPVMDVSGFAAVKESATSAKDEKTGLPKCHGEEVKSWVAKLKAANSRGSVPQLKQMTFGYSSADKGYFRRFKISYNAEADSVTVDL